MTILTMTTVMSTTVTPFQFENMRRSPPTCRPSGSKTWLRVNTIQLLQFYESYTSFTTQTQFLQWRTYGSKRDLKPSRNVDRLDENHGVKWKIFRSTQSTIKNKIKETLWLATKNWIRPRSSFTYWLKWPKYINFTSPGELNLTICNYNHTANR